MSITFAKKNFSVKGNPDVEVSFLNFDSSVTHEEPILINNQYISKEDHKKLGKIEIHNEEFRYYLKQYRGGRPGELLVDPWGMLAKAEDLSAFSTQRGHRFCEYVRVREELFNTYKIYLKTRDPRYFQGANKAILDGDNL